MVRAVMERLVLFHYDQTRTPSAVIESQANRYNFKGYLQCDGFAGYETAFKTNPDVLLINCMIHIRRHLEQALDENRPMAEHGLKEIQHLYKIVHMCDGAQYPLTSASQRGKSCPSPSWRGHEAVDGNIRREIQRELTDWPSPMPIPDGTT